jgi:hypothetical protein
MLYARKASEMRLALKQNKSRLINWRETVVWKYLATLAVFQTIINQSLMPLPVVLGECRNLTSGVFYPAHIHNALDGCPRWYSWHPVITVFDTWRWTNPHFCFNFQFPGRNFLFGDIDIFRCFVNGQLTDVRTSEVRHLVLRGHSP